MSDFGGVFWSDGLGAGANAEVISLGCACIGFGMILQIPMFRLHIVMIEKEEALSHPIQSATYTVSDQCSHGSLTFRANDS